MSKKNNTKKQNPSEDEIKDKAESVKAAAEDTADAVQDTAETVKDAADEVSDAVDDAAEDAVGAIRKRADEMTGNELAKAVGLFDDDDDKDDADGDDDTDGLVSAKEALQEIAAEETAAADGKDADSKKKKKHERTPEEEKERALNRVKRLKKLKYGSLSTVITIVVIAIVVLLNVICNVIDKRYNLNIDLTSTGLYELDEQTVNYLHQLNDEIEIAVMAKEDYFLEDARLKVVAETLNRFRTESGNKITVKYLDLTKNPEVVRTYNQYYDGEFSQGDVVVKNGELVRVLALYTDLVSVQTSFDYNTYQQVQNISFIGEQSLISAIMGVTDLHPVKVAMIDRINGVSTYNQYDQYSFQRISELLTKNNYDVTDVDIATDELSPEEYDLAILCAPFNDLTEAQITKLTDYLNNNNQYGKNMIYFGSPYQMQKLENVEAFLEIWGVKIGGALVCESDQKTAQIVNTALGQVPSVPVLSTTDNALNANAVTTKLPLVGTLCCPVEALFESNAGRTVSPLLTSSDSCYLQPINSDEEFDRDTADRASYTLATVSELNFTSGSDTLTSKLVTFGSSFLLDYIMTSNSGSYANAGYFISVMNTLTGRENVITIEEKSLDTEAFTITESQAKALRNITVLAIPCVVALLGIVVYVRRRNK